MLRRYCALCWAFAAAVCVYDATYAVTNAATMAEWEINPVVNAVYSLAGVWGAVVLRLATFAFAATVCYEAGKRARALLTGAVVLSHAYLAVVYAVLWTV